MERKYYTEEQILEALSEVGVGAGDISAVMSCLGRMSLNNNSTKVDRKNDDLIRRQDAIDAMMQLQNEDIEAYGCKIPEGFDGDRAVRALRELPSEEPNLQPNLQPTCNQLATDCISRQDAIDAVNELTRWYYETFHEKRPTAIAVIDKLMDLPSAEAEIIYCGDCKYKDDGIDEDGIPFLKCLNGRSYGGTRINDFCSWAERRTDDE